MATLISPAKSIFKSKTAFAGALATAAGAVGTFWPEASPFIQSNASVILLLAGALQIALRMVTKGRVVLFAD